MTPVATLVTASAMTWDAALEETLSRASRGSATAPTDAVHSVHARAANLSIAGRLIAIVSAELDDAPWTIRLSPADWNALDLHPGAPVHVAAAELRIGSAHGEQRIALQDGRPWTPEPADLGDLDAAALRRAREALAELPGPGAQTAFGRVSAQMLDSGIRRLRDATAAALHTGTGELTDAVGGLIGLGEGLTPSGDDVLTGLAFLAAQPGMRLGRILPALAEAVGTHGEATTLLSLTTLQAALTGRARARMHDFVRALQDHDSDALTRSVSSILAIGHTSGADLLAGIHLALSLEADARTPVRRITDTASPPMKENTR